MKHTFVLALLVAVATAACGGGKKPGTTPDSPRRDPTGALENKGDATGGAGYGGASYGKHTPKPAAPR